MWNSIVTNWRTALGGLLLIVIAGLHTFLGINIPGFTMDFGAALTAGIALIVAKDAASS